MGISLEHMVNRILLERGTGVLVGMENINRRVTEKSFYKISDDCNRVVRDIQDLFGCDYFAASRFFAEQMRERYSINVD
jgi:hypothetical protein